MPRTKLKILRIKNGLTQEAIAEKIGYSRQAYAAVENGFAIGTLKFWQTVQKAFHVEASEMWELMEVDAE